MLLDSCAPSFDSDSRSFEFRGLRKTCILSQADLLSVEDWATVHLPPHQNDTMILLSDEDMLGNGAADHLVVLYANLGSPVSATVYQRLLQSGVVRFVVRHWGKQQTLQQPTLLQGYGVRLDMRNVEHKVFDNRSDDAAGERETSRLVNATGLVDQLTFWQV